MNVLDKILNRKKRNDGLIVDKNFDRDLDKIVRLTEMRMNGGFPVPYIGPPPKPFYEKVIYSILKLFYS